MAPILEKLDTDFRKALTEALAELKAMGINATVTSAWRSPEKQAELIERFNRGEKGIYKPAPVGHSHHERGLAVDISIPRAQRAKANDILTKYGMKWAGQKDPVHYSWGKGKNRKPSRYRQDFESAMADLDKAIAEMPDTLGSQRIASHRESANLDELIANMPDTLAVKKTSPKVTVKERAPRPKQTSAADLDEIIANMPDTLGDVKKAAPSTKPTTKAAPSRRPEQTEQRPSFLGGLVSDVRRGLSGAARIMASTGPFPNIKDDVRGIKNLWKTLVQTGKANNEVLNQIDRDKRQFDQTYRPGPRQLYWEEKQKKGRLTPAEMGKAAVEQMVERSRAFGQMLSRTSPELGRLWMQTYADEKGVHSLRIARQNMRPNPSGVEKVLAGGADFVMEAAIDPTQVVTGPALKGAVTVGRPLVKAGARRLASTRAGQATQAGAHRLFHETQAGQKAQAVLHAFGAGPRQKVTREVVTPYEIDIERVSERMADVKRALDRETIRAMKSSRAANAETMRYKKANDGRAPIDELMQRWVNAEMVNDPAARQAALNEARRYGIDPAVIQQLGTRILQDHQANQVKLAATGAGAVARATKKKPPTIRPSKWQAITRQLARDEKKIDHAAAKQIGQTEQVLGRAVRDAEQEAQRRLRNVTTQGHRKIQSKQKQAQRQLDKITKTEQKVGDQAEIKGVRDLEAMEGASKRQVSSFISKQATAHSQLEGEVDRLKFRIREARSHRINVESQVQKAKPGRSTAAAQRRLREAKRVENRLIRDLQKKEKELQGFVPNTQKRVEHREKQAADDLKKTADKIENRVLDIKDTAADSAAKQRFRVRQSLQRARHQFGKKVQNYQQTTVPALIQRKTGWALNQAEKRANKIDQTQERLTEAAILRAEKKLGLAHVRQEAAHTKKVTQEEQKALNEWLEGIFGPDPKKPSITEAWKGYPAGKLKPVREAYVRSLVQKLNTEGKHIKDIPAGTQPALGWREIPMKPGFEEVAGKQIPAHLYDFIDNEMGRAGMRSTAEGKSLYIQVKDISEWVGKTYAVGALKKALIGNPATQTANLVSNHAAADMGLQRAGLSQRERLKLTGDVKRAYRDVVNLDKGVRHSDIDQINERSRSFMTTQMDASAIGRGGRQAGQVPRVAFAGTRAATVLPSLGEVAGAFNPLNPAHMSDAFTTLQSRVERAYKLAMYRRLRANNFSPEEAVKQMEKYLFDYSDRGVLVEIADKFGFIPFLTYPTKAMELLLDTLVNRPDLLARYPRLQQIALDSVPGAREAYEQLNEWDKQLLTFPIPGTESPTGPQFANLTRFTPLGGSVESLKSLAGMLQDPAKIAEKGKELLGTPFITSIPIILAGYDPKTLKPFERPGTPPPTSLSDLWKGPRMTALRKNLTPSFPFGRGAIAISEAVQGITPTDYKYQEPRTLSEAFFQYGLGLRISKGEYELEKKLKTAPMVAERAAMLGTMASQALAQKQNEMNKYTERVASMRSGEIDRALYAARNRMRELVTSGRLVDKTGNFRNLEELQDQVLWIAALANRAATVPRTTSPHETTGGQ